MLKWVKKLSITKFEGGKGPRTQCCCIIRANNKLLYFYFDPFVMCPPQEVSLGILRYNTVQFQDKTSVLCGYFSLFLFRNFL